MCDGIKLVCNEAGEWEKYDDTWDITIHCRNEEENRLVREMLEGKMLLKCEGDKNEQVAAKEIGESV